MRYKEDSVSNETYQKILTENTRLKKENEFLQKEFQSIRNDFGLMSKPYIILQNPLDGRFRLFDNTPETTPYDMAICDGETIKEVLENAENWFDISPGEVEL